MAIEAHATAKYIRTSAQKAGLVLDLIRGRDVNHALATLKFARKGVARDIEKVLRSAIANAQTKDGFGGDVDRLFVTACFANQGPSQAERPTKVSVSATPGEETRPRRKGAAPKPKPAAKASGSKKSTKKSEAKA